MNRPPVKAGVISLHGREYQTVALRVHSFRSDHPDWSLTTEIIERTPEVVVMRAVIADPGGRVHAVGHAEEFRSASSINKTSALENCETSAIGRALAAFGIGGTEFASADEVQRVEHKQPAPDTNTDEPPILPSQHAEWIAAQIAMMRAATDGKELRRLLDNAKAHCTTYADIDGYRAIKDAATARYKELHGDQQPDPVSA